MYCPRCGQPRLQHHAHHEYHCQCGFHYFHNVAAAVAALILLGDELLVVRRARDPGKGLLDFPGGFVDPGETLEQALCRELGEELALSVTPEQLHWFGSESNLYPYDGIQYHTCDGYFLLELTTRPQLASQDDISDHYWTPWHQLQEADFAFDSSRRALRRLQRARAK